MKRTLGISLLSALCFSWALATQAADPHPAPGLLTNGNFAALGPDGWPTDWPKGDNLTVHKEADVSFIRFTSPAAGKMVLIYRRLYLPNPRPAGLELRIKVRYDIKVGVNSWFDARVMSHFRDAKDQVVAPDPQVAAFQGVSKDWVVRSLFFPIPKEAAFLELMPCLLQVESGTLDLAECDVFPAGVDQLSGPRPRIASVTRPLPGADKSPPELHAAANELRTSSGKTAWLQGLCLDSLEWSPAGEHLPGSVAVAIDRWHANIIRLPVKSDFWWGLGEQQHDAGAAYRNLIDDCIDQARARGAWVALDLHRFGAMSEEDIAFWKDAGTRYKNDPAVLFELFNEPHDLSWKAWRFGGPIQDEAPGAVNPAGKREQKPAEMTVGMQALLDAVRASGAHNLVIAGGLDWGYDLAGVINGFALADSRDGDGVIYSSHIYPWKSDWQHHTLDAAAKFPVFIGEVGCPEKWDDFPFIPPAGRGEMLGPNCTWPNDILGTIQKQKLNWTGFSFHPACGPPLISDWNYKPTSYWGVFVNDALAGKAFEAQRMR